MIFLSLNISLISKKGVLVLVQGRYCESFNLKPEI